MTALLDVNVLIALVDEANPLHISVHTWLSSNRSMGWATCPLTLNGCVRIISQPKYPGHLPLNEIWRRLEVAINVPEHEFWPDDLNICDATLFDLSQATPKQLTDIYLLALATAHGGRFVTFDQGIPLSAVRNAQPNNLVVL